QRDLNVTATADNKVYDGTNVATAHLSDNRVLNDVFTSETYSSATFSNRNVGTNKNVSVSGIAISGGDAPNYHLVNTTASTTANISQRPITVTAVTNVKTADGNTSAAGAIPTTGAGQLQTGDSTINQLSETYDTSAAGSNKSLTPAGVVNDGNSGHNYSY